MKKYTVAFQINVCLINCKEIWIWKNILTNGKSSERTLSSQSENV